LTTQTPPATGGADHYRRCGVSWLVDPSAWIALLTLTALEVVLGVDNVIFISILAGRLPRREQALARRVGLVLAALSRIALLLSINWLARLRAPLFTLFGQGFSGRDLILMGGGLFLVAKATYEIHQRLEGEEGHATARVAPSLGSVVAQIVLLDLVFSLDSVITAIGMARQVEVMVAAILLAVAIMLGAAGVVSAFIERHPTVKMLALSFLLLIGVVLIAEGFDQHVPRGYIYFAMGFSVFVELLNLRIRRGEPVRLHEPYAPSGGPSGGGGGI
jgi:predicted tellurium resistance membrane protein TerC